MVDGVSVYFADPGPRLALRPRHRRRPAASPSTASRPSRYVRSRHFQCYEDGRWRTDPSGDLGRISRQQDFIVRALHRAGRPGRAQPVTLDRLVDAGLATVTVDDLLTADDIIDLGRAFRSFDPGVARHSTPSRPCRARSGAPSILRLRGRGGPADPRPLPRHRRAGPAPERRPGAGAQRLRASPARPAQTSDALAAAGFGAAGTGRGRALRRHRDASSATRRGARPRPTWWPATSIPAPASSWSRGRSTPTSSSSPAQAYAGVRAEPRPAGPSTTATTTTTTVPPRRRPRRATRPARRHHVHHRRRLRARGAPGASTADLGPPVRWDDLPDWLRPWTPPAALPSLPRARRPGTGEGHRARRRAGHPPQPGQPGDVEAAHARLRQAARLLPDQHAAARPDQRDPDHLEPRAAARSSRRCSATAASGAARSATPSSPSRTASRRRS